MRARCALVHPRVAQDDLAAGQAGARADDQLVARRVGAQHVELRRRRDAEAPALAGRVGRRAGMPAKLLPFLVPDAARGERHALALQEVVERAAAEEADVLALARGGG